MFLMLFFFYFFLLLYLVVFSFFFFFQAEDGIRDSSVTGVQTLLFRSALPGVSWSRNHRRSWAKDSGRGPVRGTGRIGAAGWSSAAARAASIVSASPAIVGASKKLRSEISTWSASRSRDTISVARMESPPRAKKLSSTLTCPRPSTWLQIR